MLLALRHPDDKSKLRGVEFTWAWINEGSEVEPWVIDDVNSRLGRFQPSGSWVSRKSSRSRTVLIGGSAW